MFVGEKGVILSNITDIVLNIIYPRRCAVCHRILADQKSLCCPECREVFQVINNDYCLKCGKPVKPEEEYCADCRGRHRSFDRGRSAFVYDDRMRRSLVRYKYYGNREYGRYFAGEICRHLGTEIRRWRPDLIIPVPLTSAKLRMRGFNQAEDLAEKIGFIMKIPVGTAVLCKSHDTRSQKKLDADERRRNLKGAFTVTQPLNGLKILVIDDVYTTGSTMEAVSECLKNAGAEAVYFVTLATGRL